MSHAINLATTRPLVGRGGGGGGGAAPRGKQKSAVVPVAVVSLDAAAVLGSSTTTTAEAPSPISPKKKKPAAAPSRKPSAAKKPAPLRVDVRVPHESPRSSPAATKKKPAAAAAAEPPQQQPPLPAQRPHVEIVRAVAAETSTAPAEPEPAETSSNGSKKMRTPSLMEQAMMGEFDEAASHASFLEALYAWRQSNGRREEATTSSQHPKQQSPPQQEETSTTAATEAEAPPSAGNTLLESMQPWLETLKKRGGRPQQERGSSYLDNLR